MIWYGLCCTRASVDWAVFGWPAVDWAVFGWPAVDWVVFSWPGCYGHIQLIFVKLLLTS